MEPKVRREDVLAQELGAELLLYDAKRDQAHSLNEVTALIWRHCDGHTSVTELVRVVGRETELPASEEIVWLALDQLEQAGLLEEPLQRPTPVQAVSRRQLGLKFGLTAAVTLLLPIITTLHVSAEAVPGGNSGTGNPPPTPTRSCGERFAVTATGTAIVPGGCDMLATPAILLKAQAAGCTAAEAAAAAVAAFDCPSECPPMLVDRACNNGTCVDPPGENDGVLTVTGTFTFECTQP